MSEGRLPGFGGATGWLNSDPLTPAELQGKVVLVDFWTLTCINWLRTLAYLRAWHEKYASHGLVVIGVHTPEFAFEGDAATVERAAAAMGVSYPIALDPDYAVWQAFGNHYWPAIYLADAKGHIQFHHFGEDGFEATERGIQRLLREAGYTDAPVELVSIEPTGIEALADWDELRSPETYLGAEQGRNFAGAERAVFDAATSYAAPESLELNTWALSGEWRIEDGASVLAAAGGAIRFRFHARDANLVLRSPTGLPVPFLVLLDGAEPGRSHGVDVDPSGRGTVLEPRLYQLIRQPSPVHDRTIEIQFEVAGVEAYVFTFG
jgi:thiol-disulfide isomerase/thioredoxin